MNKGYEEFKVFVRNKISKFLTIEHEMTTLNDLHYYFFSLIEKKYALEISDGFCLYEIYYNFDEIEGELETWTIVFAPLENDFEGLEIFLKRRETPGLFPS